MEWEAVVEIGAPPPAGQGPPPPQPEPVEAMGPPAPPARSTWVDTVDIVVAGVVVGQLGVEDILVGQNQNEIVADILAKMVVPHLGLDKVAALFGVDVEDMVEGLMRLDRAHTRARLDGPIIGPRPRFEVDGVAAVDREPESP